MRTCWWRPEQGGATTRIRQQARFRCLGNGLRLCASQPWRLLQERGCLGLACAGRLRKAWRMAVRSSTSHDVKGDVSIAWGRAVPGHRDYPVFELPNNLRCIRYKRAITL